MKKKALAFWAVVMLMTGSMTMAQPGPGGPPPGGPGNGPGPDGGLVAFLELDDAQMEAWTAFQDEFRATVDPLHEQIRDLQTQLRDALDSDASDATAIGQFLLAIEAVRDEIQAAREQLDANLQSILTADQFLRYEAFRAAQEFMRRGPGGPGAGPGNGPGAG